MINKVIYIILFSTIISSIICLINGNRVNELFINTKPIVLVTGTTSGIGKAFIKIINKKYKLIIHGRNCKELRNITNELKDTGLDVDYICYDLSKKENINKLIEEVKNKYNKIDVLINNFYDSNNENDIAYQINTNLVNNIILTKKIIPLINKTGIIINISSGLAKSINHNNSFINTYSIIKNSLEKFTKFYSDKLFSKKISVTCLRIDDSFESKLTKKFIKNTELKNTFIVANCINKIIEMEWKETTGRIIKSSNLIENNSISYLDVDYQLENGYIGSIFKNKKILGENVINMSDNISKLLKNKRIDFTKYRSNSGKLEEYLINHYKIEKDNLLFHNGTMNFLSTILRIFVKPNHNIITTKNCWQIFQILAENNNNQLIRVNNKIKNNYYVPNYDLIVKSINAQTRMIYFIGPLFKKEFDNFLDKIPNNLLVVIDFCYNEFFSNMIKSDDPIIDMGNYINSKKNIIGVNTFSKFHSLPGLNTSYSITNSKLNKYIRQYFYYSISGFNEIILLASLKDKERSNRVIKYYNNQRNIITNKLNKKKKKYIFTYQNTVYIKTNKNENEISLILKKNKINLDVVIDNNYIEVPIIEENITNKIIQIIIN